LTPQQKKSWNISLSCRPLIKQSLLKTKIGFLLRPLQMSIQMNDPKDVAEVAAAEEVAVEVDVVAVEVIVEAEAVVLVEVLVVDLVVGGEYAGRDGTVWVFEGPLSGTVAGDAAEASYSGGSSTDSYGVWAQAPGDVDGDGFADLAVAAGPALVVLHAQLDPGAPGHSAMLRGEEPVYFFWLRRDDAPLDEVDGAVAPGLHRGGGEEHGDGESRGERQDKPARAEAGRGEQRLQLHTLVDHQCAGAFRPAQLVRGKRHGMYAGATQGAEIQRQSA